MKKIITITMILAFVFTFASFEFDGWNPRNIATGGDNLTLLDSNTFFTNIGILPYLTNTHIEFATSRLYNMKELENTTISFIKPYKHWTMGVGMMKFGCDLYREQQLQLGVGFNIGKNIGFGIKGKYMSVVIDEIGSGSTWAMDMGLIYYLNYKFYFGLRLKNVSQPYIGDEYIYRDIALGVNYKPFPHITFFGTIVKTIPPSYLKYTYGLGNLPDSQQEAIADNIDDVDEYDQYLENFGDKKYLNPEYHFGVSYRILDIFILSGGLRYLSSDRVSYSGGLTISAKGMNISYTLDVHSELGATHYFSFGIGERDKAPRLSFVNGKIDINIATIQELTSIPGIGRSTARNIIDYRKQNGPFRSVDELVNVTRIGKKTVEKIRPYVYVAAATTIDISKPSVISEEKETATGILVDINRASKKELMILPRIGPKTAERIVEYRKLHQGFKNKEDIMNVSRIGPKTYEQLKDKITVGEYDPSIDE